MFLKDVWLYKNNPCCKIYFDPSTFFKDFDICLFDCSLCAETFSLHILAYREDRTQTMKNDQKQKGFVIFILMFSLMKSFEDLKYLQAHQSLRI